MKERVGFSIEDGDKKSAAISRKVVFLAGSGEKSGTNGSISRLSNQRDPHFRHPSTSMEVPLPAGTGPLTISPSHIGHLYPAGTPPLKTEALMDLSFCGLMLLLDQRSEVNNP